MDKNEMIEQLKQEAKANKVSNAVFHVLAMRRRARHNITLNGLQQRMKAEGFDYKPADYIPAIRLLAKLGFGQLDVDSLGKIRGLKDIKTTLQSIGVAAVGNAADLANYRRRLKFQPLTQEQAKVVADYSVVPAAVGIKVEVNGKSLDITIPGNFSSKEIVGLLDKIRGKQPA